MTLRTRESGVEYLGAVPEHWQVRPAVTLARVLTSTVDKKSHDGEVPVKLCNYTDVYYGTEITDSSEFMEATASENQIQRFSVRAGDVPFTKDSETSDDIAIPAYIPRDLENTVYGYHLGIFRPNDVRYGRFLRYLLESNYARTYFETNTPGVTRVGLSQATVRYFRVPTPPVHEAVAIADFLDRETAQIDAFIAKNEQLITLLTERRAAVIGFAVTKGLDRNAKLVDSGFPWLGDIPSSWRAVRVKFVAETKPGHSFPSDEFVHSKTEVPLLRGANVGIGEVVWNDVVSIEDPARELVRRYMLAEGDLVLGMDRPIIKGGLRIAAIEARDEGALLVQRVLRLRGLGVSSEYLRYSLSWGGFAMYIEPDFTGVSVPHMSEQQVGDFTIALPDVATQDRVVAHVSDQMRRINRALATARQSINLARERRAALISAAVTGKIDVGVDA